MLQFDTESTICAIATGEAPGLRGAIRITGPDTIEILTRLFPSLPAVRRPTRWEGSLVEPHLGTVEISVFLWPDHRSYTGQISAELHMLGAPVLLQQVQLLLQQRGAILAQPGEFTLRAFLAGRLDLTQCEAVLGVIHANTERSLDVALKQLAGGLAEPLQETRRDLIHLLADIEAGLDFVDEDIAFISNDQILERLCSARDQVRSLLNQMESRAGQSHECQVAIVGLPNAGKSSLLNAIAASDVSIVSPTPGTTRDYLRYRVALDGLHLDLLDTAGLESWEDDSPRGIAQSFTQAQIDQADLILYCVPASEALADEESDFTSSYKRVDAPNLWLGMRSRLEAWISSKSQSSLKEVPVWVVLTKSDLAEGGILASVLELTHHTRVEGGELFCVSAVKSEGIGALREGLREWIVTKTAEQSDAVPMTVERCRGSLGDAEEAIAAAYQAASVHAGDEVIAGEIRIALDAIGQVAGTVYTDDVLDALFSRFCIGK